MRPGRDGVFALGRRDRVLGRNVFLVGTFSVRSAFFSDFERTLVIKPNFFMRISVAVKPVGGETKKSNLADKVRKEPGKRTGNRFSAGRSFCRGSSLLSVNNRLPDGYGRPVAALFSFREGYSWGFGRLWGNGCFCRLSVWSSRSVDRGTVVYVRYVSVRARFSVRLSCERSDRRRPE